MKNKRRQIVIGNWKLQGDTVSVADLLSEISSLWTGVHSAEVVVCPSHVHLYQAYNEHLAQSNIGLGAQDASVYEEGAYTGDISAQMLHEIGCQYALVGHSERRNYHAETNEQVARKFERVLDALMTPVLCVGESLEARKKGNALSFIESQLKAVINHCGVDRVLRGIIAYEPIWAVGTGKTASPEQAQEVHGFIRDMLGAKGQLVRVIYGGSVSAENADTFFAKTDIDGALVGGASLDAQSFIDICRAAELSQ